MPKLKLHNCTVEFDETSLITFYNDNAMVCIGPTELTAIYGAYRQMKREQLEDESVKRKL